MTEPHDATADATHRRAVGALVGLAVGDALGMPTESLPRAEIVRRFAPPGAGPGWTVGALHAGPPDHPIAAGLPAGSITDDTEQALLLAGAVLDATAPGGPVRVDAHDWAQRLLGWEREMAARGRSALLGPSTQRALQAVLAGERPETTGRFGTTNGAAMRIAPVGIATPARVDAVVDAVVAASAVTHHTSVALAGAAAVAGAVSAGVAGAGVAEAVDLAVACAEAAVTRGHWVAAADVAARIHWAGSLVGGSLVGGSLVGGSLVGGGSSAAGPAVAGRDDAAVLDLLARLVGTSLQTTESVPAAFACVLAAPDDPWRAVRLAASAGGDCDTVAAMTGAIAGAVHGPEAFPADVRATVLEVNRLDAGAYDLDRLAGALLGLRDR